MWGFELKMEWGPAGRRGGGREGGGRGLLALSKGWKDPLCRLPPCSPPPGPAVGLRQSSWGAPPHSLPSPLPPSRPHHQPL